MNLIKIENLSKSFGGLVAVNRVSLELTKASIVGLIGPNGAGKTTLFNLITGFYRPDQGLVNFKGQDIVGLRGDEICKLGISRTFQLVKPFRALSVLENVMVGAYKNTTSAAKAAESAKQTLTFCGLDKRLHIKASSLTLADMKRLELARALATDPELLLLDEVMSGLNPAETDDLMEVILRINQKGITLFIIEHVMKALMSISEKVVVLNYGEKIAEGGPQEVANDRQVIEAYLGEDYALAQG